MDDARCGGEFSLHFALFLAPVAQWIERRFPKPQVACSIHAGGTSYGISATLPAILRA